MQQQADPVNLASAAEPFEQLVPEGKYAASSTVPDGAMCVALSSGTSSMSSRRAVSARP